MTLEEVQDKILKLKKDKESLKKYINFGHDIEIIQIEEAIESYDKKIKLLEKYLKNYK